MVNNNNKVDQKEIPVEERLKALYDLQMVMSEIDKIKTLRGELPLEVQDLEDEIAGLETRIQNYSDEIEQQNEAIVTKKNEIKEAELLIERYKEQQNNVRNNREFDSLSKEIEYQTLEIELCNKRIKEFTQQLSQKKELVVKSNQLLEERRADLVQKNKELDDIISENQVEEERLLEKGKNVETLIEERLLTAFKRIRKNARNGLAVVPVERDSCGGCFNKIPPQRQMDIRMRKKIIVCDYCGRILVDDEIGTI